MTPMHRVRIVLAELHCSRPSHDLLGNDTATRWCFDHRAKHRQFAFQEHVHLLLPLSCGATPLAFLVEKLSNCVTSSSRLLAFLKVDIKGYVLQLSFGPKPVIHLVTALPTALDIGFVGSAPDLLLAREICWERPNRLIRAFVAVLSPPQFPPSLSFPVLAP